MLVAPLQGAPVSGGQALNGEPPAGQTSGLEEPFGF